jgi:hypothetical protein
MLRVTAPGGPDWRFNYKQPSDHRSPGFGVVSKSIKASRPSCFVVHPVIMNHILYIQRLPQLSLTRLYWPCRHPLWFRGALQSKVANQITRSGAQPQKWLKYTCTAPVIRTQFIDSKQATPTAFDPCTLAGVPTMDFRDTPDLLRPARGRCTDEITPSK